LGFNFCRSFFIKAENFFLCQLLALLSRDHYFTLPFPFQYSGAVEMDNRTRNRILKKERKAEERLAREKATGEFSSSSLVSNQFRSLIFNARERVSECVDSLEVRHLLQMAFFSLRFFFCFLVQTIMPELGFKIFYLHTTMQTWFVFCID
jgi:hypothetical protein